MGRILDRAPVASAAFIVREVDDGNCALCLLALAAVIEAAPHPKGELRPHVLPPEAAG